MSTRDEILGRLQESYVAYFQAHGPAILKEASDMANEIQERGGSRDLAFLQASMHISHSAVTAALNMVADELAVLEQAKVH